MFIFWLVWGFVVFKNVKTAAGAYTGNPTDIMTLVKEGVGSVFAKRVGS
jgi:hypothetical protein